MIKTIFLAAFFFVNGAFAKEKINLSSLELVANKEHVRKIEKGDEALVYFWAAWCKDCKKSLKTILTSLHEKGVAIFAVNRDRKMKKANHYIKKHKILIPVYRDGSKSISKKLKAFSVPHWAVVRFQGSDNFSVLKIASGDVSAALSYFKGDR